jgi:UDPglucose--hexose-1-phosphate uridylyltransferase
MDVAFGAPGGLRDMNPSDCCDCIEVLVNYGTKRGLIEDADRVCVRNRLLEILGLSDFIPAGKEAPSSLPAIPDALCGLVDYGVENGLCEDSSASRDLFDTKLMGTLCKLPSWTLEQFRERYRRSPREATDWFYEYCHDVNYIRRDRNEKNLRWTSATEYGDLDITINLAKPEKDPRDIAAALAAPQSGYPACLLCAENEGYAGTLTHPARQNHRIIPIDIAGEAWGLQYSPYIYYNEHCIVLNMTHVPMVIGRAVFAKLISFLDQFPHYFVGSNADLPIVGGSILTHEHFQGGNYEFAMAKAPIEREVNGYGVVKWPMSAIRISDRNPRRLTDRADALLSAWRRYSDPSVGVFAETKGVPHNTVTPIARMRGAGYELDLVLRNNITSEEHPLGVFHPHSELHHIKKENIGLIEVMGLAVLPARLVHELEAGRLTKGEIGSAFLQVLRHAGVFKRDGEGRAALDRFLISVKL